MPGEHYAELKPHGYSPDHQAMGDCRVCGLQGNHPIHNIYEPPETPIRRGAQGKFRWDE